MDEAQYITDTYLEEQREYIAADIKVQMKEKNVSIDELAEATSMKPATIDKIINAKFWPNMKQYVIILAALNMEVGKPVER